MPLSTTNVLSTAVMKEASDHAFSAGSFLMAGSDYVKWNTAGAGETFRIPFFPSLSPLFQDDSNALSDGNYTPTSRNIVLRKVQKAGVFVRDSDATMHGDYLAKETGKQIGLDMGQYFCNIIAHGVAEAARAASNATEIAGTAGATASVANIQAAFWDLIEESKTQGINLSESVFVCRPRVAVAIRQLAAMSSSDYAPGQANIDKSGYFDVFKGPGGLKIISPINAWFGSDKSGDTTLPNDSSPVSARLDYRNYFGVLWQTTKLHVAISEDFNIAQGREDEKFHNFYTGRMIWGFNLSDLAGARALMNASS